MDTHERRYPGSEEIRCVGGDLQWPDIQRLRWNLVHTVHVVRFLTRCTGSIHPQPGTMSWTAMEAPAIDEQARRVWESDNWDSLVWNSLLSHGGLSSTPGTGYSKGENIILPFVMDWYRLHWNKVYDPNTWSTLVTSFCGATQQEKVFEKRRIIQNILKAISAVKQSIVNGHAQGIRF